MPGFWYEKNVALSHPDYGSVRVGSMTARGWSVADYPYGGNVGQSYAWGSSGAGYGMLTTAVRVGTRPLDVAEGDLFLELTYDQGNTNFKRLVPKFYELYAQYHRGDLVVDAVYQDATNGGAGSFAHTPFTGVTPFVLDDSYINPTTGVQFSGTHQSIAMIMARYQLTSQIEISGGARQNHWSGADVVYNPVTNWTAAFNADFTNPFAAVNPGYSAISNDFLAGARYRTGQWTLLTGLVYLGKATTQNPSERGQSNSAIFNTFGARYEYVRGVELEATAAFVKYGRQGLAPTSMPSNSAFEDVDSRVTQDGRSFKVGMIYTF